jgi:DNA invertase Pin-like site-specific DNA recombinase
MLRNYGYARVSTARQSLDQQVDALVKAGVETQHIYSDKMSGVREDRPGLLEMLGHAREGDTVTVVALDRLGRSLTNVIQTIDDLEGRGVHVKSLREGVDFSTDMGRLLAGIFSSLAEYERKLIKERAAAAREAARARGKHVGRKPALTRAQAATALKMRGDGFAITEIAATMKVSRASIYRHTDVEARLVTRAAS